MKRSLLGLFFTSSLSAVIFGADQTLTLDTPLHFASAEKIFAMSVAPPHDAHPAIGEALTYLTAYAPKKDMSKESRDALMLALCEDRTPRQLMILGFVLRLEILKLRTSSGSRHGSHSAKKRPLRKAGHFMRFGYPDAVGVSTQLRDKSMICSRKIKNRI